MNAHDLLFKTARFNLTVVKDHFINPCCFGEDLAIWLRDKLIEKAVKSSAPGQEDWGWYLMISRAPTSSACPGMLIKKESTKASGE